MEGLKGKQNEITETFLETVHTSKENQATQVTTGSLQAIIDDVKRPNLPAGFSILHWTVQKRVPRGNLFASHRGQTSPLISLEQPCITTVKQMCRIRRYLILTQRIAFVKSIIIGTGEQKKLAG